MAYSRAHASGLWQFIPATGKRYDLAQNSWYDGRRDIVASTEAALDYLQKLYEMHGDWHLALAAYNWGEGNVARAIDNNQKARAGRLREPQDAGRDAELPAEAAGAEEHHPRPRSLRHRPRPDPEPPYFAVFTRTRDIDVRLAAKLAEMPVDEFLALNPSTTGR